MNPIIVAIPLFFAAIGVEAWIGRNRGWYRVNDTHADLGAGVLDQVSGAVLAGAVILPYSWVYEHRLVTMPDGLAALAIATVFVDFCYYWWHRLSHRVAWMWAIHAVHHQSVEYNLAVALRQDMFAKLNSWAFYLPLAVVGLSPAMMLGARSIDLLYQFWIHTRAIDKLGPVEWVMNTPSHHRVHHAINRRYIDKNYAGIFIVFDRLFGTFTREETAPDFGTVVPFESWNPLTANLQPWRDLWAKMNGLSTLREKIMVWWHPPEWLPNGVMYPFPGDSEIAARTRYDNDAPRWHSRILGVWIIVAMGTIGLLAVADSAGVAIKLALATGIVAVLAFLGERMDRGSRAVRG